MYCGRGGEANADKKAFDDPRIVFEVLSAGTPRTDLTLKLEEYKAVRSIDTIVFVDIVTERLRIVQHTGPTGWTDIAYQEPTNLVLLSVEAELTHAEIFEEA